MKVYPDKSNRIKNTREIGGMVIARTVPRASCPCPSMAGTAIAQTVLRASRPCPCMAKMAMARSVAQALLPVPFILHSQEWLCHQLRAEAPGMTKVSRALRRAKAE